MDKARLLKARNVLTRDWRDKFQHPTYVSASHRLYSDDGQWYLHQDGNLRNPNGACLYKA